MSINQFLKSCQCKSCTLPYELEFLKTHSAIYIFFIKKSNLQSKWVFLSTSNQGYLLLAGIKLINTNQANNLEKLKLMIQLRVELNLLFKVESG